VRMWCGDWGLRGVVVRIRVGDCRRRGGRLRGWVVRRNDVIDALRRIAGVSFELYGRA
jgi:hypothetical protein